MRHGKYQKRTISPVVWIVLILAVLGMSFSGARAYLSHSGGTVTNSFTTEVHPTISVDEYYKVTVSNTEYAVYLRAAVVVNWDNDASSTVLPAKSGEYTLAPGPGWVLHGDFYYYNQAVTNGTIDAPVVTVSGAKSGYTLKVDVAVQAIQAVGQTDGDSPVDAVFDAWGITAGEIKGTN